MKIKNIWNHQLALPKLNLYFFNSPKWFVTSPPSYWKYTNPYSAIGFSREIFETTTHQIIIQLLQVQASTRPQRKILLLDFQHQTIAKPESSGCQWWSDHLTIYIGNLRGPIHQVTLPEKNSHGQWKFNKNNHEWRCFSYSKKIGWFSS